MPETISKQPKPRKIIKIGTKPPISVPGGKAILQSPLNSTQDKASQISGEKLFMGKMWQQRKHISWVPQDDTA